MGHVQRDVNKTQILHDTIHPYTDKGVKRLLKDIYKLENDETYKGDYNAVLIRVDLERALQSDALTPKQRCVIGLYYFCQLTQDECGRVLEIERNTVKGIIKSGIRNISRHMRGESVHNQQDNDGYNVVGYSLHQWLKCVSANTRKWWNVWDSVLDDLNGILGMPERGEVIGDGGDIHFLTDRQMRTRNKEHEILRDTIYPPITNVGTMRSFEDGRKVKLHKDTP